ncbi:hypothetical protein [Synechococcus sp. A15-127]|uniref:hypothetical protein n=1 Tax=Synechococcus sp. A15-127 TaxID=1050624 RepID=UPI00164540F2|nr:hypothetical protein [Synechococcus sp. A15-127]
MPSTSQPLSWLLPLDPIPTADFLLLQLATQVGFDLQFGGVPEAVHLQGDPSLVWAADGDGVLVDLFYP